MRMSKLLMPTLREVPAEAEISSHQLMLRAGLIRKLAAGVYSYLPLGLRSLKKVEQIVREEMDRAGAQELLMYGRTAGDRKNGLPGDGRSSDRACSSSRTETTVISVSDLRMRSFSHRLS